MHQRSSAGEGRTISTSSDVTNQRKANFRLREAVEKPDRTKKANGSEWRQRAKYEPLAVNYIQAHKGKERETCFQEDTNSGRNSEEEMPQQIFYATRCYAIGHLKEDTKEDCCEIIWQSESTG
ncbi:hypothetical protein TNCV_4690811 [Trichonephila clavipes]|nr:hypothetical protein TNCV_4690811 [Trichonephila clavipes]